MDPGAVAPHSDGGLDVTFRVCDGDVREACVFAVLVHCVHSEAVDAFVKPEPNGAVVDSLTGGLVIPVEIGLFFGVEV